MGSKRLDWIDIAKGIAIILVIVGHTVPNPSPLRHAIFSFHMPVFFILAGYTFRPKPWRELLSGSVSRLLVPVYDAASIVALRVIRTLCLRYWVGIRDQEGVIKSGEDQVGPLRCHYAFRHSGKTLATVLIACGLRYCSLSFAFL